MTADWLLKSECKSRVLNALGKQFWFGKFMVNKFFTEGVFREILEKTPQSVILCPITPYFFIGTVKKENVNLMQV